MTKIYPISLTQDEFHYGNLMSYKIHIRPTAHRLYGGRTTVLSKHQKDIRYILHILFHNGPLTTWQMAKIDNKNIERVRIVEQGYRRLFMGRLDANKRSDGMFDLGLIIKKKGMKGKRNSYTYGLSLYGILYYLDVTDLPKVKINAMISKYADLLPKVFGIWRTLKSALGDDAYKMLRILSEALFFNSSRLLEDDSPLYGLMHYTHVKYRRNFESISEKDLAEQVSYWFYTFLLYPYADSKRNRKRTEKTKEILADAGLEDWYAGFFKQAVQYYQHMASSMKRDSP